MNSYWIFLENSWVYQPVFPPGYVGYYVLLSQYNNLFLNYRKKDFPEEKTLFATPAENKQVGEVLDFLLMDLIEP